MPRKTLGYSKGTPKRRGFYCGRLRVKKPDGKWKDFTYQARNKTHAKQIADDLERKYILGGIEALEAEVMTFAELAENYRKAKVIDPIYRDDIKVGGMIAKESAEKEIKGLLEYWSNALIQQIRHADIEEYKIHLLTAPVVNRWWKGGQLVERQREEPRKMSSVNHLLRRLRIILNYARRKGWLTVNPFNQGDPLICESAEVPRNRAEKAEELQKLLNACTGRRRYLRAYVLIMADTAMRLFEAKRLTRKELDFDGKVAHISTKTAKGCRERTVPLSDRVIDELRMWCDQAKDDNTPILRQVKRTNKAWDNLKEAVGITDDLQLRDLRGWATGRIAKALAKNNLPREWGMKITGHTQIKTYLRYIKTDDDVAKATGEALKSLEVEEE